ncbi:MAG: hypothetical protein HY096_09780 [Nitrospinae bacterium]|nr:hypothetical protein [Nitrospinota bacterium]
MKAIYETNGRAKEYCALAVNLYNGCSHGCIYCYAPTILHKTRENFLSPSPRIGIIEAIKKEANLYTGREVLLCFTTDPYQLIELTEQLTKQAIEVLHSAGVKVNILTKGGHNSMCDFCILIYKRNLSKYGCTLTFVEIEDSKKYEPMAALTNDRIYALKSAYALGIDTWVSLEPVIDPAQTIELIRMTHSFVNEYRVGKWNHSTEADRIDWRRFTKEVVRALKSYRKKFYIKKDLSIYL